MINHALLFKQTLLYTTLYLSGIINVLSDEVDLLELSVEDLLNVNVISVSKKAKTLNNSPAAVFVITQNDIKRIGATSIPEALRLSPGLDVSQINASQWAVSARGFNGQFANKLLVLIDGRNTYTRTFAGIYWENQDIMLEDVERIEVIRGPGATLWGANAVNGVINIITKHSSETQGTLLAAGSGTENKGFGALRYGTTLATDTTARAYVKGNIRDDSKTQFNQSSNDHWNKVQGGFRIDSQLTNQDTLTLQGDAFSSQIKNQNTLPTLTPPYQKNTLDYMGSVGGNLLLRHQHTFSSTSDYSLQIYYDSFHRDQTYFSESQHIIDINFDHHFNFLEWNDVVWGMSYNYNRNDFTKSAVVDIDPVSRNDQFFSTFIQDEITLIDDTLWLTIGSKFEHNDYSGFEIQPTARIMWIPHHQHRLWAAISRAVRTPARAEHDFNVLQLVIPATNVQQPFPTALRTQASPHLNSEEVLSYEIGYRTTFLNNISIDFTAFYNNYSQLRAAIINTPVFKKNHIEVPMSLVNKHKLQTYGFEISSVWQLFDWWRMDAHYRLLKTSYTKNHLGGVYSVSPQQQVLLRNSASLGHGINIDIITRYTDENFPFTTNSLNKTSVNDYFAMDVRLAWQATNGIELSLIGQNLLATQQLEYTSELFSADAFVERGVYGKIVWEF